MIARSLLAATLLAASWFPETLIPPVVKRWLGSPRAATARGVEAFGKEQFEEAVPPLRAALDAAPSDTLRQFNAGTAELGAGQAKDALPLLEQAARGFAGQGAGAATTADALYNLGNARLAAGDAAGAVEAYKQTLRTLPEHGDAKHNLELALRQLEQERQAKSPQESPEGGEQGEEEQSSQGGQGDQSQPQQQPDPQSQPDQGESEQQPPQPQPGQPADQQKPERLPNFQPQEDMTADQAAAILEAVENLEREARRAEAAKRASERRGGERDW